MKKITINMDRELQEEVEKALRGIGIDSSAWTVDTPRPVSHEYAGTTVTAPPLPGINIVVRVPDDEGVAAVSNAVYGIDLPPSSKGWDIAILFPVEEVEEPVPPGDSTPDSSVVARASGPPSPR